MHIIYGPETVKASMVNREPIAESGYWFVYLNPRGKSSVVDSGNRLSQIELKAENFKNRYMVRKVNTPFTYRGEYQSKNPGRSFLVSTQLRIVAQDPISIIKNEVNNVEEMLRVDLEYWLSQLCIQYEIKELQEIKSASRNLETNDDLKSEMKAKGFLISNMEINISLSNEDMAFYRTQEQIKLNEELERVKFIEKKRTQELQLKAEEEELERQRQRQKLEREEQLQAEKEEEEKRRKLKEEKRADKERLAQRRKEEGIESIIFERDEEHAENVDILLSRVDKEKEHERQLALARHEAELREKEKKEEHTRKMEEKRMEMMQKLMETQLSSGNPDQDLMRTIINAFDNSSNSSSVLVEKKADDSLLSWEEEEESDTIDETHGEKNSNKDLWG